MNKQEAAKLVSTLLGANPATAARLDRATSLSMVDAYHTLLEDIPYETVSAAARVLLQTRAFIPSAAELRGAALELVQGSVAPGGEAWGKVLRAIQERGAYRQPGVDFVFHDPTTAQCVAALGWQALCLSENPVADRARFIEMYDKLAAQQRREHQAPILGAAKEARGTIPDENAIKRAMLARKLRDLPPVREDDEPGDTKALDELRAQLAELNGEAS